MSRESESKVERRKPDWWALESAVTERRDIVDDISDATGYFHDDEAAKLRKIASESGMRPVGIVRAAVEKEIDNREWRCVYFDDSEERGYISSNAYEYYRIHRAFELEYEAAIESLPKEENAHLRDVPVFEHAADRLEEEARHHRAKREKAERFLKENGYELPDVEDPGPESDEPELVTDGGSTEVSQYADKQLHLFHEYLADSAYHAGQRSEERKEQTLRKVKSEFEDKLDDLGVNYAE